MRLIDADALTNHKIDELCYPIMCKKCTFFQPYDEKCLLEIWVDDAPTIDAKLHGVWKTAKDGKYGCSVCGLPAPGGGLTSFCPNCGAKMDGESEGE